ncbi:hypothetical protein SAMN04487911_10111 [Arenibacter nanhaiticus]|uniref:Uncharacterized protein n=1 Tax=Arenibacter nanhaiticus TaxID=558155 RepID=A0A1M6A0A9_9FLAO|nr:hypothetical protein SAMN04487911_10111 [Arenibacter nanhaiticus]
MGLPKGLKVGLPLILPNKNLANMLLWLKKLADFKMNADIKN